MTKEQAKITITKKTLEKLHNEIWNRALEAAAIISETKMLLNSGLQNR